MDAGGGPPYQTSDSSVQSGGGQDASAPFGIDGGQSGGSGGTFGGTFGGGTLDAGMTPGGNADGGPLPTADGGGAQPPADGGGGPIAAGPCTRDNLKALVDKYFEALAAHNASSLPLASNAKYTENGETVQVGEGAWKTAGMLKFKRSAIDTQICTSVTESVIENEYSGSSGGSGLLGGLFGGGGGSAGGSSAGGKTDFVYGVRLKVADGKITEIETILVGPDGWFPAPDAVLASASDDWDTLLPPDKRPTRDELKQLIDGYFELFAGASVDAYPFASSCTRLENGFSPGACNFGIVGFGGGMKVRLYVLDVEAGISLGFVMFAGAYTDFHMLKVRDKQVQSVHAVLAAASGAGWTAAP